jgi:hypothetical protein
MKLQDALYNWLQIRVVADARPHDQSAQDTAAFFQDILTEDHRVTDLQYGKEEEMYWLRCKADGTEINQRYDAEAVESLLVAIQNEPKYNQ